MIWWLYWPLTTQPLSKLCSRVENTVRVYCFQQLQGALPRCPVFQALVGDQDFTDLFCTVCNGLSEVIGSWKIIAMRLPRKLRNWLSLAVTRSD